MSYVDLSKDAGVGSRWLLGIIFAGGFAVATAGYFRQSGKIDDLSERLIRIEAAQAPLAKAIEDLASEVKQLREARIAEEAVRQAQPKQPARPGRRR